MRVRTTIDSLVTINFKPMQEQEFIFSNDHLPNFPALQFQIISKEEARKLYFTRISGKTNVYIITGGQRGDESKGKATETIRQTDPTIHWAMAPSGTHNAGKGVYTTDELGNAVRLTFHLCPATLSDKNIKNYIGKSTQVNLFKLEEELETLFTKTGRNQLGINYHLMVDSFANLVLPMNRAEDIVCVPNAMGSTVAGATFSYKQASGKNAPILEHLLYDHQEFIKFINRQMQEFNDKIKHDTEFESLNITGIASLGNALQNELIYNQNDRLKALAGKLSKQEIDFFVAKNPAEYLFEQYTKIIERNLFYIGDCTTEINKHLEKQKAGILESVQSVILSGPLKLSRNRTAAGTHSAQTIADANLDPTISNYIRTIIFKYGNTAVGGNDKTISGFIAQDQLSKLSAYSSKTNATHTFEKTSALDQFLEKDEIESAFFQISVAFTTAIKNGNSLTNSTVTIKGIDCLFSLAEANALFTAYHWGETGETSKRARICRLDDAVETGLVYGIERNAYQIRNALDRITEVPPHIITSYKVIKPYAGYNIGDIILPEMQLRQEHLTVDSCIPIIAALPTIPSLNNDGTNNLFTGAELHPNLCTYLTTVARGNQIIAIANGPKAENVHYIK